MRNVRRGMGAVGSSADNALGESFNATLKRETLPGAQSWPDQASCRRAIFRWATRYNTRRRHSYCRLQDPDRLRGPHHGYAPEGRLTITPVSNFWGKPRLTADREMNCPPTGKLPVRPRGGPAVP